MISYEKPVSRLLLRSTAACGISEWRERLRAPLPATSTWARTRALPVVPFRFSRSPDHGFRAPSVDRCAIVAGGGLVTVGMLKLIYILPCQLMAGDARSSIPSRPRRHDQRNRPSIKLADARGGGKNCQGLHPCPRFISRLQQPHLKTHSTDIESTRTPNLSQICKCTICNAMLNRYVYVHLACPHDAMPPPYHPR